jgi:hypothetical protein
MNTDAEMESSPAKAVTVTVFGWASETSRKAASPFTSFMLRMQPFRLIQLQTAVSLSPAVVGLLGDFGFLAELRGGPSVGDSNSICRSIVTICSGLYPVIDLTGLPPK